MNRSALQLGLPLDARARTAALWAALLGAAAIAWALTIQTSLGMSTDPGTMGRGLGGFVGMWTLMMAAMMLPSVAPVASVYLRTIRSSTAGVVGGLRGGSFLAGYLGIWACFGIVAFVVAWAGGRLASEAPGVAPWVGSVVLAAAGIYQLTPLKDRCLAHCRSPLGFLLHFGSYSGKLRDLRVGAYHGGYCVGCCWGLMVVLIAVGLANVAWMAGLAAVIFLEKTWRYGKALSVAFGIALVVLAFFVPSHTGIVPGLHLGADPGAKM